MTGAGDHVPGARQSIHHATGTIQLEVKSSNQVAKGQSTTEESRPPHSVEAGITVTANLSDEGMVPCCGERASSGGERAPDATRPRHKCLIRHCLHQSSRVASLPPPCRPAPHLSSG